VANDPLLERNGIRTSCPAAPAGEASRAPRTAKIDMLLRPIRCAYEGVIALGGVDGNGGQARRSPVASGSLCLARETSFEL
jgi:hypothetical protein